MFLKKANYSKVIFSTFLPTPISSLFYISDDDFVISSSRLRQIENVLEQAIGMKHSVTEIAELFNKSEDFKMPEIMKIKLEELINFNITKCQNACCLCSNMKQICEQVKNLNSKQLQFCILFDKTKQVSLKPLD